MATLTWVTPSLRRGAPGGTLPARSASTKRWTPAEVHRMLTGIEPLSDTLARSGQLGGSSPPLGIVALC